MIDYNASDGGYNSNERMMGRGRVAVQNREGLTFEEWCDAAALPMTDSTYTAWLRGEDPCEWRVMVLEGGEG